MCVCGHGGWWGVEALIWVQNLITEGSYVVHWEYNLTPNVSVEETKDLC